VGRHGPRTVVVTWLAVAAAGGAGAVARFLVDLAVSRAVPARFPLGTLAVNVTGSFAAGLVTGLAITGHLGIEVEIVVAGGFLGAYTTFSTAMVQAATELLEGRRGEAVLNLGATLALSFAAAAGGIWLTT
jgi:fluoride exporter